MRTAEAEGIRIAGAGGEKGLGAFATRKYEAGLLVGDYEGEILTRRELDARQVLIGYRMCCTARVAADSPGTLARGGGGVGDVPFLGRRPGDAPLADASLTPR